ncbi:MAG: TRAP transporter small permease subunit, partial [Butyrivibrio hungatei]|nr:TRAP transporter small permease subunit [Butyrivibrio hungatei]
MKKTLMYLEENLEEILMVIALLAMVLIMGLQVISRYVLHISLSWSEEITRYLFIWSAF